MDSDDPCPCESDAPPPAPGRVEDTELLVRLILTREHIPDGHLLPAHWSSSDLHGKKSNSASILRECTPKDEITRRAKLHFEKGASDDPPVAIGACVGVRRIVDKAERRDLCVNAEPSTAADDKYGACSTHAGIVRSVNPPKQTSRTEMLRLKAQLCDLFSVVPVSSLNSSAG